MENQLRKVQFKYLDYLFEDIYEVESAKYNNSKFWKKDNGVVIELRPLGEVWFFKNELWVLKSIWKDIENMFSLDYDETQKLIKEWMGQRLGLEDVVPTIHSPIYQRSWNNI